MKPKYTIAIPTYNRLSFLKEAIKSVLQQNFNDYELLIIDNQSTDETWAYLQKLKIPNLRIYQNHTNLGMVANWSECIKKAHGQWLKFLMSDDLLMPNSLKTIDELINKFNLIIYSSCWFFKENSKLPRKNYDKIKRKNIFSLEDSEKLLAARKKFYYEATNPGSYILPTRELKKLIKSQEYKTVAKYFGKTGHGVDYYLFCTILKKHQYFIRLNNPVYAVRNHSTNGVKVYIQNLLYHLEGDKLLNYLLFQYQGIENIYVFKHALKTYIEKILFFPNRFFITTKEFFIFIIMTLNDLWQHQNNLAQISKIRLKQNDS